MPMDDTTSTSYELHLAYGGTYSPTVPSTLTRVPRYL
uniref:Long chain acyl-CoA synthetase 7 n=1 Tax=Rhizophora mucronata TaxID=61149 RepID=A0A2P2MTB5_RHIMU